MYLLQEKDEVQIKAGIGSTEEANTTELQLAYASTDHLGLMANLTYFYGQYSAVLI